MILAMAGVLRGCVRPLHMWLDWIASPFIGGVVRVL